MTTYKHQEQFGKELSESWVNGNKEHVRTTIRGLKNKAQAAYVALVVFQCLCCYESDVQGQAFLEFMHPNNA